MLYDVSFYIQYSGVQLNPLKQENQRELTTNENSPINQLERKPNTCRLRQAREHACDLVVIA